MEFERSESLEREEEQKKPRSKELSELEVRIPSFSQQCGVSRKSGKKNVKKNEKKIEMILAEAEYLTDPGLVEHWSNWLVMARPEGRRCLVIASRGRTVAKDITGRTFLQFASALPGGSPQDSGGNK